jgi:hypothetical protein
MEGRPVLRKAVGLVARLAIAIGLFGLIAPAAYSAPQPKVCPSSLSHAISV